MPTMMSDLSNNWKNKKIFTKQLELNLREISSEYPLHWKCFVKYLSFLKSNFFVQTLLDVGCGSGVYSKLTTDMDIGYTGIDYSEEAIDIAKQQWPNAEFLVKDYRDLTNNFVKKYDVIHAGALHNVLRNGDEAIRFFVELQHPIIILGRIMTTNDKSYYKTYRAYNEIETYMYFHNLDALKQLFNEFNYDMIMNQIDDHSVNFLLLKTGQTCRQ